MLQSSAYRTKQWPRRSSSLSSTSSIRFDNSGESGPPCGVPSSVGPTSPSISTPAVRKPRISFRTRLSATRFRSEEHTSELQSHSDLVCRLLLEKKKRDDDGI